MSRFRSPKRIIPILCLAAGGLAEPDWIYAVQVAAPPFQLSKWQTGETVALSEFAGEIVVLDFFAYWCVPCRRTSKEIEAGIREYYAFSKGNAHGVPVRVVSVNIEKDNPNLTARFIQETDVEFVLNDFDGALLEKFGGAATPHIVVIDGTLATPHAHEFRVAYNHSGFEGTKKLRQVIDSIRPPKAVPTRFSTVRRAEAEKAPGPPLTHKAEAGVEALISEDIQTTSTTASYGQNKGDTEWKLSLSYNSIDEDYEPFRAFDFLGFPEHTHEDYFGGQASVRQKLGDSFTLLATGAGYDGFTDFRSVWLSTYYQQQFGFLPGYDPPEPRGFSASAGFRWEYQPTTGFVEAGFLYSNDEIAPGYEMDPITGDLIRGRERLHTYAPGLKFENVLTTRIRVLHELQLTITSGREPRYAYRGSINVALAERWVWRTAGGYTHEDPTLRAWFAGSTLEYEITPRWLVSLSGRFYRDTGEIENSLLISSAAPGLETWRSGAGLRYLSERWSFNVWLAPVFAEYQPVEIGTRPFTHLYRDRTWLLAQVSWAIEF
jgi:thiol-disulfide isomerase/thioredoxin